MSKTGFNDKVDATVWQTCRARQRIEVRPYVPGEDLEKLDVRADLELGDYLARVPERREFVWPISGEQFHKLYEAWDDG